jgi:hypothetical protein
MSFQMFVVREILPREIFSNVESKHSYRSYRCRNPRNRGALFCRRVPGTASATAASRSAATRGRASSTSGRATTSVRGTAADTPLIANQSAAGCDRESRGQREPR